MLLYKPPFLTVDGVTVFADHADPEAFYYLVSVPELVQDEGKPALWATALLPPTSVGSPGEVAAAAGIARLTLALDVELPFTDAQREAVTKETARRYGREVKRLVPVPLHGGTASLLVARPDADQPSKDFFAFQGHAPSLVGACRAAFALSATGLEAQALVATLTVGQVPAIVVYDLEFLGLAPTFKATMKVNWRTVYRSLRERDLTNLIFVSEEIDRTVESMDQRHGIDIHVEELDPAGAGAATKALFDELKTQVVKRLFEQPRALGAVPIEDRIGRGVRDVLTALLPGVSHSLRELDQSVLAEDVINLSEQRAKPYPCHPQSSLPGMLARAGGLQDRLAFVRLDELPHRQETITVEVSAQARALGVSSVVVDVRATSPERAAPLLDQRLVFEDGGPTKETVSFRRLGTAEPDVRFRAEFRLDPERAPGGRERWEFGWTPVEGGRVWLNPAEWLDLTTLVVEIDDPAMFDHPSTVEMALEVRQSGTATLLGHTTLRFSREDLSQAFSVVVPEGARPAFSGREIVRRQGEPDFTRAFATVPGPVHRIMNPFSQAWRMEVRAVSASNWTDTEALVAEMRVWDVARRTWLRDEHRFTKDSASYVLSFSTSPDTPRDAQVRVTRIGSDGSLVRGPWRDVSGPVTAVDDRVEAKRRVRVRLVAPHFAEDGVDKASVDLEYADATAGVQATRLDLPRAGAVADWIHAFTDPSRPLYRFRLRARGHNGERFLGPWTESGADDLDLTLPRSPWQ